MDSPEKDPFYEIIDIVRKSESNCELMFQETLAAIKDGSIPYELGMRRIEKIEEERRKNKAIINRLDKYLKNVKITEK